MYINIKNHDWHNHVVKYKRFWLNHCLDEKDFVYMDVILDCNTGESKDYLYKNDQIAFVSPMLSTLYV